MYVGCWKDRENTLSPYHGHLLHRVSMPSSTNSPLPMEAHTTHKYLYIATMDAAIAEY